MLLNITSSTLTICKVFFLNECPITFRKAIATIKEMVKSINDSVNLIIY